MSCPQSPRVTLELVIRPARPDELAAVGDLTVAVYVGGGLTGPGYVEELRDTDTRARQARLLVAVERASDRLFGAVTYATYGSPYAEIAVPGEAEFRMLVVDPAARGHGIGEALVRHCLDRARDDGCSAMVLSTGPKMLSAHRLYERLGFRRLPERDWSPVPGVDLRAYRLEL